MSHELTVRASGKVEMAYFGETPWHHLGAEMKADAPISEWIKAAGMDWTIESAPVEYRIPMEGAKVYGKVKAKKVQYRSDSKAPLAVVGADFQNVQPRQTAEFFQEECEKHGWKMGTMGTLFGGRQFWALAHIGDESAIFDKRDTVRNMMLMSTACDGTRRTEFRQTAVRVVCNNTISLAHYAKASHSVSHRTKFDASSAKRALNMDSKQIFAEAMSDIRAIAEKRLNLRQAVKLTLELFKPESEKLSREEAEKVTKSARFAKIIDQFSTGQYIGGEFDAVDGTAWGWLNTITQNVDHDVQAKTLDHRLDSAWFGRGDDLKNRAFELALAL